ncbi:helicase-associated domain-containing protein [Paenibacillus filicis]|uniref:Helicase-associated domain-containing protein n=1 Tax=Paenibacillus gyeongsangnamensis TaxID=3388067 RepID=A0ABT4Q3F2_9BACL|nr:helicase-associated domain-containing protein [Paenibacillus filicis]MCZ8511403.1 helicase-associated domain-containing protein [Paenibacillus filicis]
MRLTEITARMPDVLYERLASDTAYASWIARGEPLLRLLTDPAVLETVWNRMTPLERRVLRLVMVHMGCEPFDEGKLERRGEPSLSGAELRLGFTGLLRLGIVFAFRKSWGELVYVLPEETLAAWQRLLAPELPPGGRVMAEPRRETGMLGYCAETGLAAELFHALVYAAKYGLKLTKSGTLHKKHIQKLAERNCLDEAALGGAALKFAFADAYPLKLAVVLDCLLRLELAVPGTDEWVLEPEALSRWLSLSAGEQNRRLYACWRSLTLPSAAWQQHALILLERLEPGEAFSSADLLNLLALAGFLPAAGPEETAERVQSLEQICLMPLAALGWLEPDGQGSYVWRLHPAAADDTEEEGALIVQPDFEILVPPDVPPAVCWELGCLADLVRSDQMSIYKLSKETLKRALENSRTAEEIEAFLVRHSLYELPDHVLITLRQWMKPFGQTEFREAILLRLADAETARSVAKLPGAAGHLTEPVGEKDFIIAPSSVQPLFDALERAGYMPVRPDLKGGPNAAVYPKLSLPDGQEHEETSGLAASRLSGGSGEKGLLYSRHSVAYFEMESTLPEVSLLYPEMSEIPGSWLRDFRSYHPSTRKEMIEQAIRMRTLLLIRKGGRDYRVAPRKLQESRGSWCMTGWEQTRTEGASPGGIARPWEEAFGKVNEIRWMADEWQEMKLLLPGINDQ